jgi:hypothetical protein
MLSAASSRHQNFDSVVGQTCRRVYVSIGNTRQGAGARLEAFSLEAFIGAWLLAAKR